MILKGSQRASGADLATHLMNAFDNDHVEIAEISGAVADDLHGAFAEFAAIATGTRAREYLYSLSINPPAPLTRDQYDLAIVSIEQRLGLSGQPRAVVFHVKDGREHCHVVWSRIDAEKMRAVHLSHDHRKLCDLACELAGRFGLDLPPGLRAWQAKERQQKERLEPTVAENVQAAETGMTPAQRETDITAAYQASDTAEAFRSALAEKSYVLARGDRRGLVVVDRAGHVHRLTRYVKGHKAKAIKARLAALDAATLPDVTAARVRQTAEHEAAATDQSADRAAQEARHALAQLQAARRLPLTCAEQDMLVCHAAERLALQAAQQTERQKLLVRTAAAVMRMIRRLPAMRSILWPLTRNPKLNPAKRHALELRALRQRHARERAAAEREKRSMEAVEARERRSFERTLRRQRTESAATYRRMRTRICIGCSITWRPCAGIWKPEVRCRTFSIAGLERRRISRGYSRRHVRRKSANTT